MQLRHPIAHRTIFNLVTLALIAIAGSLLNSHALADESGPGRPPIVNIEAPTRIETAPMEKGARTAMSAIDTPRRPVAVLQRFWISADSAVRAPSICATRT